MENKIEELERLTRRLRQEAINWWGCGMLMGFIIGFAMGVYLCRI